MKYLLILLLFISYGCSDEETRANTEWTIPASRVLDGGPGKDGIPSIDAPNFDNTSEANIQDEALVVGVIHDGEARAYPHDILDQHEIVNDNINELSYAVTYCPLTGTAIGWNGEVNGQKTTFGVSGKLYNTNLIPFDRATDSYWSQIGLDCINGELIREIIETVPVIETSWATWRTAYPDSKVMNRETGFSRNYDAFPYGDYRTNDNNIIFPLDTLDTRLPAKERVLAVLDGNTAKVYSLELFAGGRIIEDRVGGQDVTIIGSKEDNYIVAFAKGTVLDLTYVDNQLPTIATYQTGNSVNLDGTVNGSNGRLDQINSFMSYYFALASFYEVEVYED